MLHKRPFSGDGLLLDFITKDLGLVRCISKYARKSRTNLQMLIQLTINIRGNSDLKTLINFQINDNVRTFGGGQLILASYINELLLKTLTPLESQPDIFNAYTKFLHQLTISKHKLERYWLLRLFEKQLLVQLGFGLNYQYDSSGCEILPTQHYHYQSQLGFICSNNGDLSGTLLLKLASNNPTDIPSEQDLRMARLLLNAQLQPHLGYKKLKTKMLFFRNP